MGFKNKRLVIIAGVAAGIISLFSLKLFKQLKNKKSEPTPGEITQFKNFLAHQNGFNVYVTQEQYDRFSTYVTLLPCAKQSRLSEGLIACGK